MKNLISWLKGKKTIFVGAIMVILSGLWVQGYIDEATYKMIMGVLTGLGLVSLRLGMMKK